MKKILLSIVLFGITISLNAQDEVVNGNLTVNGSTAKIGGNITGTTLRVEATDESGAPARSVGIELHGYEGRGKGIYISDKNTSNKWFIGEGYNYAGIGIGYSNTNKTEYSENAKFFINSNGNIGIGTVTPSEKFEIKANSPSIKLSTLDPNDNYQLKIDANYDYSNKFTFKYGNVTFLQEKTIANVGGTSSSKLFLANYYGLGLSGNTNNPTNKDQIDLYIAGSGAPNGSGNVGIGTTNPDMKLTVKGNIHAEEVKIDLSVPAPDYVFKKDYNLRSIEDVEKYIIENSHLPEIPSAKEFEQNGVMQAEMDMNLLKKIEELTLYTIQQQKEIEQLKLQNKKLLELQLRLEKLESEK